MSHQSALLGSRRFLPFFLTQFLGAFNDNLYKNGLVVLLTFQAAGWTTLPTTLLGNLAAGIFILPFFLFSATAGQLADKYDKARLARLVKLLEIAIMGVALAGFLAHSLAWLLAAVFLLGCHSTLFGPVKYALLPQHLRSEELIGGNALVEAGTFVAILAGTLAGGLLAAIPAAQFWIPAAGLAVALAGYGTSRHIPPAPPPEPGLRLNPNPLTATWHNVAFARRERTVFLAILGISWFWLYGALFLAQFPAYAKLVLGGGEGAVTLLLATFTVGIGVGSLLCERLSRDRIELGLVPFGAIGLTLFGLDLALASPTPLGGAAVRPVLALLGQFSTWRVLADLTLLGIFGGFFIVPLYALIQSRSAVAQRARIIAANNILNALFMVAGALGAAGLLSAGLSIPALFAVAALLNAGVALHIFRRVPEFRLRFLCWLHIVLHRLRCRGLEHIPAHGPALLACPPGDAGEALLILAASPRPVRLAVDRRLFDGPLLGFALRESHAIPLPAAGDDPALLAASVARIGEALAAGELVGLFPPPPPSQGGSGQPLEPDLAGILARHPVPVIPVAVGGLAGGEASRNGGREGLVPRPRGLFAIIELRAGPPLAPGDATPGRLRAAFASLAGNHP